MNTTDARHLGGRSLGAPEAERSTPPVLPPTRFERTVDAQSTASDTLPAVLATSARAARSQLDARTMGERIVRDVAAGVGGPLLVGFAVWMLDAAREAGVHRLYFLARDGQVLLEVARILAPRLDWDPDALRYLSCSRRSISAPLLWDAGAAAAPWMWPVSETTTAQDLVERSGLTAGPADAWLRAAGIDDPHRPLTSTQRSQLEVTFAEDAFGPEGRSQLERQRTLVTDHLHQEGFLDDLTVGTVDSGGYGSQLQALAYARQTAGRSLPAGYCLQLLRGTRNPAFEGRERGWLEDGWRGLSIPSAANLTVLLETFCASDHGSVLGYHHAAGRVEPLLGPPPPPAADAWDRGMLRRAIVQVATEAAATPSLPTTGAATRDAVLASVDDFWEHPTRQEVAVWGRCPIDATTAQGRTLAAPVSLRRALRYRLGLGWSRDLWQQWPEGCIRVSRTPTRFLVSRPMTMLPRLLLRVLRRGRDRHRSAPPHPS